MNVFRVLCCTAGLLAALGCKTSQVATAPLATQFTPPPAAAEAQAVLAPVAFQEPLPHPAPPTPLPPDEMFGETLTREWLQVQIEARNPSLEAMIAAWQAAAQLYPQRIALDDPVLMGMIAPDSAGSPLTETAYALQLNQKLPWLGKRPLRGAAAAADADAARQEAEDTRLQVRLAADLAFYDYFLASRLIELNRQMLQLMQEFRATAQDRFQNNLVTEQDLIQADVELAELARRQLEAGRMHQVAMARINTLLRRWPDAPLPPPALLDPPRQIADSNLLWQTALQQRPDLAALAWKVQSEEAALALAYKNSYPDIDAFARYDTFWQPASTQGPLRAQVGLALNLPVYRRKLNAAVCEAQFRVNQRRAEFEQRTLEIQYEVITAAQQVEESRRTIELYDQRLTPRAKENVAAVRANYIVAKATFLDLAQAQRQLVAIYERQAEALVTYHRRLSELDRAVGIPGLR